MRLRSDAHLAAGVGDGVASTWPLDAPVPITLGRGAIGGWIDGVPFGATARPGYPGFQACTWPASGAPPDFVTDQSFQVNEMAAGGAMALASNGAFTIGAVPPGYETWQAHDVSRTNIRVLRLNDDYAVFWPGVVAPTIVTVPALRACDDAIVTVDRGGLLRVGTADGGVTIPAQRLGEKYGATLIAPGWLGYLCAPLGQYIVHAVIDASQGYVIADYHGELTGEGVRLADGRAVIAYCTGAQEQAHLGDLHRTIIDHLGVGMVPFVVPPIPPIPPEPPMPPTDPLKPGKSKATYLNLIAHVVHTRTGMPETGDGGAWQGVNEAWDQLHVIAKDWMSASALARGAFCRNGSDAVKIPQTALDAISIDCKAIDQEYLQGR